MSTLCKNCFKRRIILCQKWITQKAGMCTVSAKNVDKRTRPTIKIPKKKKRDALTVLKALASTVGPDPTRHSLSPCIDDPILTAHNTFEDQRNHAAYISGKQAARNMVAMYPELVMKSIVHDPPVPNIEDFIPKKEPFMIKEDNEDALKERIDMRRVEAAYELYQKLSSQGVEISQPTMDMLLELFSFYGDKDEKINPAVLSFYYSAADREQKERFSVSRALDVFGKMTEKSVEAYNSALRATLDPRLVHDDKEKAQEMQSKCKEIYKEMLEKKIGFERCTYHRMIKRASYLSKILTKPQQQIVTDLLKEMMEQGYMPTIDTFNTALEGIHCGPDRKKLPAVQKLALQLLAEMKALKIEPALLTWYNVFVIFLPYDPKERLAADEFREGYRAAHSIMDQLEGKQFTLTDSREYLLLPLMIKWVFYKFRDVELAHRMENFHRSGLNQLLLTQDSRERNMYYFLYFQLIKTVEGLDSFMETYRKTVPSIHIPRFVNDCIREEECEAEDKFEYFAEVLQGPFVNLRTRERYLDLFGKRAYKPEVQAKFAEFVKEIKTENLRLEMADEERGRQVELRMMSKQLGHMITVNVYAGDFKEAWECYELTKNRGRGTMASESPFKLLVGMCIEMNEVEKVIDVLCRMADEQMVCTDDSKALVLEKMKLDQQQRETISNI